MVVLATSSPLGGSDFHRQKNRVDVMKADDQVKQRMESKKADDQVKQRMESQKADDQVKQQMESKKADDQRKFRMDAMKANDQEQYHQIKRAKHAEAPAGRVKRECAGKSEKCYVNGLSCCEGMWCDDFLGGYWCREYYHGPDN